MRNRHNSQEARQGYSTCSSHRSPPRLGCHASYAFYATHPGAAHARQVFLLLYQARWRSEPTGDIVSGQARRKGDARSGLPAGRPGRVVGIDGVSSRPVRRILLRAG